MLSRTSALASGALALVLVSCSREPIAAGSASAPAPAAPPAWTLQVQPLTAPTARAAMLPRLTTSDRGVILSWVERAGKMAHLKFAERTTSGWSEPVAVASGDTWFLSYADPPTVLRRTDGTLVASWLIATNPLYEGSDLNVTYSTDAGKTWARPFTPHHDGTEQQHGFPSFFELPGSGFGVIWLDGRAVQPDDTHPEGGGMMVRYAAYDATWRRTAEGAVDMQACECCSTSAAVTSDGVLAVFRDRSENEIRDIAVSLFENGAWTEPTRVHDDNWEIFACPVNGPMVRARDRNAVVVWFTVKEDEGQSWAAFSSDAGRTWGQPIRLDDGSSVGRVGVELLDDGSAIASWVEYAENRGEFRVRRIQPSGVRSDAVAVASASARLAMDSPRVARHGNELLFAWTESASADESDVSFRVHTAIATVP